MTLEELRQEARDRGLSGFSQLNKAELEALLAEDDDEVEEEEDVEEDEAAEVEHTAADPDARDDELLKMDADPSLQARMLALSNGNVAIQTGYLTEGVWETDESITISGNAADLLLESARNVVQEAHSYR